MGTYTTDGTLAVPTVERLVEPGGSAASYLQFRQGLCDTYAAISYAAALQAIAAIANQEWVSPPAEIDTPWQSDGGLGGIPASPPFPPTIDDIEVEQPPFTAQPPDPPDITWDMPDIPPWTATPPAINIPNPPDVVWPVFDANPPSDSDINIPTAPDVELPAPPLLSDVPIPSPPSLNIPSWDGTPPSMDLTPPDPQFYWNEAEYNSEILDELRAKILYDIINGGTGLGADVEQAIWDRALSRQATENEKTYDEALNYWSARGFELPPGALVSRLLEARNRIDQINEDLNNDILIQQSKLAQENTHFIITSGINLEKMLIDAQNNRNQRMFEAAKYGVEAAILIYNARVEAFKAQLENYKVLAEVYEIRIRAEIARVEIYKAQIEGAKLTVEIQTAMIEAYKAQLQGVLALIEVYKAEMEGANILAQIDRTRVEGYKARVEAYAAEVGAITSRFNAYQAQVSGEKAKAEVYTAEANAYVAQISGFKALADIQVAEAEVEVQANRANVDVYNALVLKYRADVEMYIAAAEAIAKEQGFKVDYYKADVGRYQVELDTKTKVYMTNVEQAKNQWDVSMKEAELNFLMIKEQYEWESENLKSIAQLHAQLGVSALSALNTSAHISYSESRQDSSSESGSASNNDTHMSYTETQAGVERRSYSEQHIHNYNS